METRTETYESPVVVTFGELDFEPAGNVICSTLVTCSAQQGHCVTTVNIVPNAT